LQTDDQFVMISGVPPIRAKKLRYYEDANFTPRLGPPPNAPTLPKLRPDDWSSHKRSIRDRLASAVDEGSAAFADEGGHELRLTPALEGEAKPREPKQDAPEDFDAEDEFQEEGDAAAKRFQRAAALDRVDKDLLPDF
jgi:type IV secretion system protein VirD4